MEIQTVFEVSAIASVIGTIISFIVFRKTIKLKYITKERKEWRCAIQEIVEKLENSVYDDRNKILVLLKTRINAYGINSKSKLTDSHIWENIHKIEQCKKEDFPILKEELIEYLSLLLKYDWERSKKEVYGEPRLALAYLMDIFATGFWGYGLYILSGDNLQNAIPDICLIIFFLIFGCVMLKMAKTARGENIVIDIILMTSIISLGIEITHQEDLYSNRYLLVGTVLAFLASCIQFMEELKIYMEKKIYQKSVENVQNSLERKNNIIRADKVATQNQQDAFKFILEKEFRVYEKMCVEVDEKYEAKRNIFHFIQKTIRSWSDKKHAKDIKFTNYAEWEDYISNKLVRKKDELKELYIYVKKKQKVIEQSTEFCKSIAVPLYMTQIAIAVAAFENASINSEYAFWTLNIVALFLLVVLAWIFYTNNKKINFYQDITEILKKLLEDSI